MTKEVIGLIVGTVVTLLSFVFVCGTFLFLYLRDQKLVRLAQSSVQGTVIGYSRFREGIHLSSNTRWMGLLIRKPCSILCSKRSRLRGVLLKFQIIIQEKKC